MIRVISTILALLLIAMFSHFGYVKAETPEEALNQYTSDLKSNPNDTALREKIIKLVQIMKPAPSVPEEAERYMARGTAAVKSAKDANDFKDAVREFEKASLAAPWLANVYYNLGIAQDKAGMYADAIKSLKLYLIAVPDASDAKKLIYEIEYRQEKAAKESSPEVIAEKKMNQEEEFIKKLNGARFVSTNVGSCTWEEYIDIRDRNAVWGMKMVTCSDKEERRLNADRFGVYFEAEKLNIVGRRISGSQTWGCEDGSGLPIKGFINEDGNTITIQKCNDNRTFRRER